MCSSAMEQQYPDEFEEYRARATSGGSLYGLLKRQGFIDEHGQQRERSQSLFHGDRGIIPMEDALQTHDDGRVTGRATKNQGKYEERRRFSAACVDARDITCKQNIQVSISPPPISNSKSTKKTSATLHDVLEEFNMQEQDKEMDDEGGSESSVSDDDQFGIQFDRLRPPDHPLIFNSITEEPNVMRRRSFCTTQKGGVKNEGDILTSIAAMSISQSASIGSELSALGTDRPREGSFTSQCSGRSDTPLHRIIMLGSTGVGKTALSQQFMTSEYMGAQNTSFGKSVSINILNSP